MFKSFFLNRKWLHWSFLGTLLILGTTWYKVQLSVDINEWFGEFYDTIQQSLTEPNTITLEEFLSLCLSFGKIVTGLIIIAVLLEFFIRHYIFRWRTALHEYYTSFWPILRHIEGASQRVQEDTIRFAKIVEGLGVLFIRSIMTLIAFLPILWELSKYITELPWIGPIDHSMVYVALISAASGTVVLAIVGIKLPGLEFNNQKVEAAYRKELVLGEDSEEHAKPPTIQSLFQQVRQNYFILYKHYLYFDVAKWTYLQCSVLVPYVALAPTIVAGGFTLGVLTQITRAFSQVESSFQILVHSWGTIIELMSIYKRLHTFEQSIKGKQAPQPSH